MWVGKVNRALFPEKDLTIWTRFIQVIIGSMAGSCEYVDLQFP
jgi:hypothetical protein